MRIFNFHIPWMNRLLFAGLCGLDERKCFFYAFQLFAVNFASMLINSHPLPHLVSSLTPAKSHVTDLFWRWVLDQDKLKTLVYDKLHNRKSILPVSLCLLMLDFVFPQPRLNLAHLLLLFCYHWHGVFLRKNLPKLLQVSTIFLPAWTNVLCAFCSIVTLGWIAALCKSCFLHSGSKVLLRKTARKNLSTDR